MSIELSEQEQLRRQSLAALRELGIDLPETWTDLYQRVLPRLYENNMSFSLPVDTSVSSNSPGALRGFTMLLLQMGGEYYNGDGESSALDTPEAYKAFKFWTDMYANYGIDAESNFFTRIRTGDCARPRHGAGGRHSQPRGGHNGIHGGGHPQPVGQAGGGVDIPEVVDERGNADALRT